MTGIEGTYRKTCESVMAVLRHNKDSLMAVLEAFVYDPLLNWRLMDAAPKTKRSKQTADSSCSSSAHDDGLDAGDALAPSLPKKGAPAVSSQENGNAVLFRFFKISDCFLRSHLAFSPSRNAG